MSKNGEKSSVNRPVPLESGRPLTEHEKLHIGNTTKADFKEVNAQKELELDLMEKEMLEKYEIQRLFQPQDSGPSRR